MSDNVCVIGAWHLGTVTSACLAEIGYTVVGLDADTERVDALNAGRAPLFEPGLDEILTRNLAAGRLRYTTDPAGALAGAAYVFIAYDTPVDEQDDVDLSPLFDTAADLARYMGSGAAVIVSSQVPVGTCERLAAAIREANPALAFHIACLPENLRLGQAIGRFLRPEMLVIGADDAAAGDRIDEFLSALEAPRVRVGLRTAEMIKHALNAFLATSISFINEIANLCDQVGADAVQVAQALRLDSRIGPNAPLKPGLGFAGGTLARDLKVLLRIARDSSYEAPLLSGVLAVNQGQNRLLLGKLAGLYPSLAGVTVGVLGLTYKAGTSTLRRSPALPLIEGLAARGALVRAYDPKADPAEVLRRPLTLCPDAYSAALGAHALLLVTEWPEFQQLDFQRLRAAMARPVLLDPQNMLDPQAMSEAGFLYLGTGRGQAAAERRVEP